MEEIKDALKGKTGEDRAREIKRLLKEIPWTVGDYKRIKDKLRRELKEIEVVEQAKKASRRSGQIRKETPQFLVIGETNTGKSTLINNLTNANIPVGDYLFTTSEPQLGSMVYEKIKFQLIELPAVYEDCWEHDRSTLALVYSTDCMIILCRTINEYSTVIKELEKQNVELISGRMEDGFVQTSPRKIPTMIIYDKDIEQLPSTKLKMVPSERIDLIKKVMFEIIRPIRLFTMNAFNEIEEHPIVFYKDQVTVEDVVQKLKRKQIEIFKDAVVLEGGPNGRRKRVGITYELSDNDIIHLTFHK
jgi:ribosome-interacting GTPase 1